MPPQTMAEEPQTMTLQQRMAALGVNVSHIGRQSGEPHRPTSRPTSRPPPQIPTRRPNLISQKTINIPPEQVNGSVNDTTIGNRPAAPPPLPVRKTPPPLPARKDSQESERRGSVESTSSGVTNGSSASKSTVSRTGSSDRIKAPAWGECDLPTLPPRGQTNQLRKYSTERPKYVNRAPSSSTSITPASTSGTRRPSQPALPPRLHARKAELSQQPAAELEPRNIPLVASVETLERVPRSALSLGLNKAQPQSHPEPNSVPVTPAPAPSPPRPPPVPLSSRPDLSTIQPPKLGATASTSHINVTAYSSANICLVCRDFSGPDSHAAQFPRQTVSSLQTLAHQLTSPFASPTDKARVLFMWLHLNIRYDVDNFFRGTVKGSTPQSTLQSGLAVCEGYAALFTNLATHAGLESIVISGHGKGFGYTALAPGSPLPPYNAGHAWNAVKIDNGEWKLIDTCWGAGHVQGANMPYVQKFAPEMFSMPNEEFGIKHFPGNKGHFFLRGGSRLSWEEYIQINPAHWPDMVELPTIYSSAKEDYYIGERTVMPRSRYISIGQGGKVRFQFSLLCPHWTLEKHTTKGPPPVFLMQIEGVDGREKDLIPFEHYRAGANGGDLWYVDIPYRKLGAPGQTISCFAVTKLGDSTNTRGVSAAEFRELKGKVGMSFSGVAAWQLVA